MIKFMASLYQLSYDQHISSSRAFKISNKNSLKQAKERKARSHVSEHTNILYSKQRRTSAVGKLPIHPEKEDSEPNQRNHNAQQNFNTPPTNREQKTSQFPKQHV
jgi:hypothetical protein